MNVNKKKTNNFSEQNRIKKEKLFIVFIFVTIIK